MAYKFLDRIDSIIAKLDYDANAAEQEQTKLNARQAELDAELAALKPRRLRAQSLVSRGDRICAHCFIMHGNELELTPIPSDDEIDRFRCKKCDAYYP